MITLTPVIEFSPVDYSDRPSPAAPGNQDVAAWQQWWRDSLADAGITELEEVGTWSVHITEITRPETLATLLRTKLKQHEIHTQIASFDDLQPLRSFYGGYVLQTDAASIYPNCCGTLADLSEWETAANRREPTWLSIWIGHPWVYCRYRAPLLEFTAPTEKNAEDVEPAFTVDPAALSAAVETARATVTAFGERIKPGLASLATEEMIDQVLDVLLWGDFHD